jgi:hypothetical protein
MSTKCAKFQFFGSSGVGKREKKLKFGFSGGLFALLFAQTKSKRKEKKNDLTIS